MCVFVHTHVLTYAYEVGPRPGADPPEAAAPGEASRAPDRPVNSVEIAARSSS